MSPLLSNSSAAFLVPNLEVEHEVWLLPVDCDEDGSLETVVATVINNAIIFGCSSAKVPVIENWLTECQHSLGDENVLTALVHRTDQCVQHCCHLPGHLIA